MTTRLEFNKGKIDYVAQKDAMVFSYEKSSTSLKINDIKTKFKSSLVLDSIKSETTCTFIVLGNPDVSKTEIIELYNKYGFPEFASFIGGVFGIIVIEQNTDSLLLGCLTDFMGIYSMWCSSKLELIMTTNSKERKMHRLSPSGYCKYQKSPFKIGSGWGKYIKVMDPEPGLKKNIEEYKKQYIDILDECLIDSIKNIDTKTNTICVFDYKEDSMFDDLLYNALTKICGKVKKVYEYGDDMKIFVTTGSTWFLNGKDNIRFIKGHEINYNSQYIYPFLNKKIIQFLWSIPESMRKKSFPFT